MELGPFGLRDFFTVMFQLIMSCTAIVALTTWQRQLKGTAAHGIAARLATEVKALSYAFFESRSPLYEGWEFPPEYYAVTGRARTNDEEASAWEHVYTTRWKELWPRVLRLAKLRAKVGALLGDDVADAAETFARIAKQLKFWMEHDISQKRAGPEIVAHWDQNFAARVRQSVSLTDGTRNDAYSREFIVARDRVLSMLRIHLT